MLSFLAWLLVTMPVIAQTGTSGSPETGKALFTGTVRYANGGPACASCHTAAALAFPGGGSLGPDLTGVYSKLGPDGLNSALETLYFPAMTPLYMYRPLTQDERRNLFAFFQSLSRQQTETPTLAVGGIALAGLVILIAVTGIAGRHRLKPVRRRLVERVRLDAGRRA